MYQNAIKEYPVKYGEIIEFKRTRLINIDNQDKGKFYKLMNGKKAQMIFTDPPWSKGNYKMFRTKAGLRGDVTETMYLDLMQNLFNICKQFCDGDIYINIGHNFKENFLKLAEQNGFETTNLFEVQYSKNNSNLLWYSGKNTYKDSDLPQVLNRYTATWAVNNSTKENDIVLDPFCGRLLFGVEVVKSKRNFYGSELIADKLALGIKRLNKEVE